MLRARKTHTPRFTDFFTDFEKKTDCFAVYTAPGPPVSARAEPKSLVTSSILTVIENSDTQLVHGEINTQMSTIQSSRQEKSA